MEKITHFSRREWQVVPPPHPFLARDGAAGYAQMLRNGAGAGGPHVHPQANKHVGRVVILHRYSEGIAGSRLHVGVLRSCAFVEKLLDAFVPS